MERADGCALEISWQAVPDLVCSLRVEGQYQDFFRINSLVADEIGNFSGDYRSLSGSGAGQYKSNVLVRGNRVCLFVRKRVIQNARGRGPNSPCLPPDELRVPSLARRFQLFSTPEFTETNQGMYCGYWQMDTDDFQVAILHQSFDLRMKRICGGVAKIFPATQICLDSLVEFQQSRGQFRSPLRCYESNGLDDSVCGNRIQPSNRKGVFRFRAYPESAKTKPARDFRDSIDTAEVDLDFRARPGTV